MTEITLELDSETKGCYIYRLKSIGANVKRRTKAEERTVWATLEAADEEAIRIAVPLGEEAEIPDGAVSMDAIRATVWQVYKRLDMVLDEMENGVVGDW